MRVALANDFEIVIAGLAAMLAPFGDQVTLIDVALRERDIDAPVDVVLFDNFGHLDIGMAGIQMLQADPDVGRVAVFTWMFDPAQIRRALDAGVCGYLRKNLTAEQLVDAVVRIAGGEVVVGPDPNADRHTDGARRWPSQELGLTERESEVLVLIADGHSNIDIARTLYLSPNSIKSHIRNAYRKIGVTTRAQAVRKVLELGMLRRTSSRSAVPIEQMISHPRIDLGR